MLAPDPFSRDEPETHPLDLSAHIGAVILVAYAAETIGTEVLGALEGSLVVGAEDGPVEGDDEGWMEVYTR